MKDQLLQILSFISVAGKFLPIVIVIVFKLTRNTPFLLFAIFWLAGALLNLLYLVPGINISFLTMMTDGYNLIDIPLILSIFYFSTDQRPIRKWLGHAVIGFGVLEIISVMVSGFNHDAPKYALGVGVAMVIYVIFLEIKEYLSRMTHTQQEKALIFIYAALMFEYCTYVFIYIFDFYFVQPESITDSGFRNDNQILYHFSSIIGVSIACIGFLARRKRAAMIPIRDY